MQKLPELKTLNFIPEGRSVILGGSPGTGKTHMAIGLGIKTIQEGYNVFFTTVSRLLTQMVLAEAMVVVELHPEKMGARAVGIAAVDAPEPAPDVVLIAEGLQVVPPRYTI